MRKNVIVWHRYSTGDGKEKEQNLTHSQIDCDSSLDLLGTLRYKMQRL